MARHHRPRILASAVAIAALLLAACGSDDDGRPEGLRDIRDTEPATDEDADPDGDAEDAPADDPSDPGNGDSDTADDQQSEPEPDEVTEPIDGVFVAADALQVNEDVDLPPDEQLELLQFALESFLHTTEALNTGQWSEAGLAAYYTGEELDRAIAGFERYERERLRQVNDGTVVEFLRLHSVDDEEVVLHRCIMNGANDGVIDVETQEYSFRPEDEYWLALIRMQPSSLDGDDGAHRIVGGGGDSDVACP